MRDMVVLRRYTNFLRKIFSAKNLPPEKLPNENFNLKKKIQGRKISLSQISRELVIPKYEIYYFLCAFVTLSTAFELLFFLDFIYVHHYKTFSFICLKFVGLV